MNRPEVRQPLSDQITVAAGSPVVPPGAGGATWRRALHGVVGAAFRLHRYRFVRTRMLHDALRAARDETSTTECR